MPKETQNKYLRKRITVFASARELAYLFAMTRFLRSVCLALYPAQQLIQRFLNFPDLIYP